MAYQAFTVDGSRGDVSAPSRKASVIIDNFHSLLVDIVINHSKDGLQINVSFTLYLSFSPTGHLINKSNSNIFRLIMINLVVAIELNKNGKQIKRAWNSAGYRDNKSFSLLLLIQWHSTFRLLHVYLSLWLLCKLRAKIMTMLPFIT